MRATRPAVMGLAAGAMVLGLAGPALATTDAKAVASPNPFTAGSKVTLNVAGCKDQPVLHQETPVFAEVVKWAKEGETSWTSGPTTTFDSAKLKAGETYGASITCHDADDKALKLPLALKVAGEPTPTFTFGYDKVQLSSRRVAPGYKIGFTVTCPSTVTITGNGFTKNPLPVKKTGDDTWTATGTFRGSLPNPTTATVVCKGYGAAKYSTRPDKGDNSNMTPKTPKIPTGRIDTGDGSTYGQNGSSASALLAAGWGALVAAGLGAVALRRRMVRS